MTIELFNKIHNGDLVCSETDELGNTRMNVYEVNYKTNYRQLVASYFRQRSSYDPGVLKISWEWSQRSSKGCRDLVNLVSTRYTPLQTEIKYLA